MSNNFLFTSESVSSGHPDKLADRISDAILDTHLLSDQNARVACEVMVKDNIVVLGGEITSKARGINYETIVQNVIEATGYTSVVKHGISYKDIKVLNLLGQQSPEINSGVDRSDGLLGAGDQGLMFGYATNENEAYMPTPIYLAHILAAEINDLSKDNPHLSPDLKTQVTVKYETSSDREVLVPVGIDSVVMSSQHSHELGLDDLRSYLEQHLRVNSKLAELFDLSNLKLGKNLHINPAGSFIIGGPVGDCGLTGRKIIVDTYGGAAHHGGGAFSGKDATKVDRSASYAARYIAKNLVAAGYAKKLEIQVAYAIGVAKPVSISIDDFGTGTKSEEEMIAAVRQVFDLRPAGIIKMLDLQRPIYKQTAAYGHFGRTDIDLPWEKLDKVAELKKILG